MIRIFQVLPLVACLRQSPATYPGFALAIIVARPIYDQQKSHRVRYAGPVVGVGPTAHFLFVGLAVRERLLAIDTNEIARIIEPSLEAMGYRLVRVMLMSLGRATLQIMAERQDDAAMTVDDCADISRSVSVLLDVADPIADAYTLEVSSPGIDRPLVRAEDYDRFAGFEARIDLAEPLDGRKRFRGRLLGRAEGAVRLAGEGGEVRLPLAAIARAKLILTDELLALAQKKPLQTH